MSVVLVQSTSTNNNGAGALRLTLGSAVTAGNLLIVATRKAGIAAFVHSFIDPSHDRSFTTFATSAESSSGNYTALGYRTATGDEQDIDMYYSFSGGALFEISGAGSAATFEVLRKTLQTASLTKSLGTFTTPGTLQIFSIIWGGPSGDVDLSETVGAGYTQTVQDGRPDPFGHYFVPAYLVAHGTAGNDPQISGASKNWGGIAVGITAGAAFVASFTGVPLSGEVTLAVVFTDTTTGSPTAWSWTFGDGGTSSSQNPTHNYTVAGTYTVVLTASKIGATSTATKVAYVVAVPVAAAGVYIDWDGDGFGTGSYDNVSSDVISWDITRGAGAEITRGAEPGSCTLVLKNPSDRYNPRNASSPLYGLLVDGRRIWIGPNSDGKLTGSDPEGVFAGRILDITPLPAGGASVSPTVEIVCEDMLGWTRREPIQVDYAEGRSHATLRQIALLTAGETYYSLAAEIETMPLSHADATLGYVLEQINAVTGTRHFAKPLDNFTDWFAYTTRNRFWRLDATIDSSLSASSQHVTGTSGWRLSADTVTNQQRATVQPIIFTPGTYTVWQAEKLPIGLTSRHSFDAWIDFDDVVRDPVLDLASTGSTITSSLVSFGTSAHLTLSTTGTASVTGLSIEGRLARRPPTEGYEANDFTSQALPRGVRAGSEISGEYLGVRAEAVGLAEHIVYRYGSPQVRPTLTVENWFPDMFELDLYDVIAFTSSQLATTAALFEIVGVHHVSDVAASSVQHHTVTYTLQECRVQTDPGWFVLNSSLLDGAKLTHY